VTGVTAWYIRHGHNPANQSRQLSHKVIDYPLTELGVAQAAALAGQLAGQPGPAAIYASPLRRAAQTAEIVAARTGSDVAIVEGLRELDVGDLDGRLPPGSRRLACRKARQCLSRRRGLPADDRPASRRCGIAELELHPAPADAVGILKHWALAL
jgi:bisphosphoglycerate-dependent phosphoglycerate mutase